MSATATGGTDLSRGIQFWLETTRWKKRPYTVVNHTDTQVNTDKTVLLLLFSTQTRTTEVELREGRDGSLLELDSINMTRIEQSVSVGRKTKE